MLSRVELSNGLIVEKTAVPMGVVAIIYESRPNVSSDAAALALQDAGETLGVDGLAGVDDLAVIV